MSSLFTQDDSAENASSSATAAKSGDLIKMPARWMSNRAVPSAAKPRPMLNANQMVSINAMISYTAHKSGQSEYRIERQLADHFQIPNAKMLVASDFDIAIRYLADIPAL